MIYQIDTQNVTVIRIGEIMAREFLFSGGGEEAGMVRQSRWRGVIKVIKKNTHKVVKGKRRTERTRRTKGEGKVDGRALAGKEY